MDKKKTSTILKAVALIMFLISLIVNSATIISDTISTTSNVIVVVTLVLGWIFYDASKILDKED